MMMDRMIRNVFDLLKPLPLVKRIKSALKIRSLAVGNRVQSRNYKSKVLWKYGEVIKLSYGASIMSMSLN